MNGIEAIAEKLPRQAIYIEIVCPNGYHARVEKRPGTRRYYCDSNTPSASNP